MTTPRDMTDAELEQVHAEFKALMEELNRVKREAERGDSKSVRARLTQIQKHATSMIFIIDPPDPQDMR